MQIDQEGSNQNIPPARDAKGKRISPFGSHFDFSDYWYLASNEIPDKPEKCNEASCKN